MTTPGSNEWTEAVARHTKSAAAFADTARTVEEESWSIPVGAGKWSPAQITEHLNQTYRVILRELRGEQGIRVRTPWLLRLLLRQTVLRSIYRKRKLPRGARAPSEIVPKGMGGTKSELLERFATLAREFDGEVLGNRENRNRKLTHHVFGQIELLPGIDFIAIHIEHHHKQIISRP